MDIYGQMVEKIIEEQESVIGPIALEQARKVPGLTVDLGKKEVVMSGDKKEILDKLVNNYKHLFGQASVEVCKDAIKNFKDKVPVDSIPAQLQ